VVNGISTEQNDSLLNETEELTTDES